MKQGKTLQELGRKLQRQRNNRQDFLADTRSLEMESGRADSILHLTVNGKSTARGVGEVVNQQIYGDVTITAGSVFTAKIKLICYEYWRKSAIIYLNL